MSTMSSEFTQQRSEAPVGFPPGDSTAAKLLADIHFAVEHRKLKKAVRIIDAARTGGKVEVRLARDHLTFVIHSNGMECQADVPLVKPCAVPGETVLVLATDATLFSKLLLGPAVKSNTVEFASSGSAGAAEGQFIWKIAAGALEIQWPYLHRFTVPIVTMTPDGADIPPHELARTFSELRSFAGEDNSGPTSSIVISEGKARAAFVNARVVEAPALDRADTRLSRDHAGKLAGVLRCFDRDSTRAWISEAGQSFASSDARCLVPRTQDTPDLEPFFKVDLPEAVCFAAIIELRNALAKVLSQAGAAPFRAYLTLEGDEYGTLWFAVDVEGNEKARVSCPVNRVPTGPDDEFVSVEAEIDGEFLGKLLTRQDDHSIELRFLESTVSFIQHSDDRVVRTHLFKKRKEIASPSNTGLHRFTGRAEPER